MSQGIKITGLLGLLAIATTGCNSTEQTLAPIPQDSLSNAAQPGAVFPALQNPNSLNPVTANQATGNAPAVQGAASTRSANRAVASLPAGAPRGRIRFTPVIGAPVNAVTPLSRQLAAEARNRGLAILSASDTGGDHVLKGYFSAETVEGNTTVYYVWDVLDPAGVRIHRIQGQEAFPGTSGDPWASVPARVMERIATRSIGEYASWRGL